jgi:hypothetical protein
VFFVSDQPKKTIGLVSREAVEQAGWLKRAWQSLFRVGSIDWRWAFGISGGIILLAGLGTFVANRKSRIRGSMGV